MRWIRRPLSPRVGFLSAFLFLFQFSDEAFLATVIRGLANCYMPNIHYPQEKGKSHTQSGSHIYLEETRSEISRFLKREELVSGSRKLLTEACLYALRVMFFHQIAPLDLKVFLKYSLYSQPRGTRREAFESLIDLASGNIDTVRYFIETIRSDNDPWARLMVAKSLWTLLQRFDADFRTLAVAKISDQEAIISICSDLWNMLNEGHRFDHELRLSVIDLYSVICRYVPTRDILEGADKRRPNIPRLKIILPSSGQRKIHGKPKKPTAMPVTIPTSSISFPSFSKEILSSVSTATAGFANYASAFSITEAYHQCKAILSRLKSQNESWPFLEPVDPVALNVPTYFDVVKHPMDLGTIEKRLNEKNVYDSMDAFERDVRLVFSNCLLFNPPGDLVYDLGKKMESVFNRLLQKKREAERLGKFQSLQKFRQSESFSRAKDFLSQIPVTCTTAGLFDKLPGVVESIHTLLDQLEAGEVSSFEGLQQSFESLIVRHLGDSQYNNKERVFFQELLHQFRSLSDDSTMKIPITVRKNQETEKQNLTQGPPTVPVRPSDGHMGGLSPEEKSFCQVCLGKLFKHKDSFPFREPVDAKALGIPQYYEIIERPMDLTTIRRKLNEEQVYKTGREFEDDVRLMFTNCYYFNGPNEEVSLMAKRLENYFDNLWKKKTPTSPISSAVKGVTEVQDATDLTMAMTDHSKHVHSTETFTPKFSETNVESEAKKRRSDIDANRSSRSPHVLKEILKKLKTHRSAWPFQMPVDAVALGVPHYYEVIKNPMDLSTIEQRLQANFYTEDSQFERDIRLIFENCLSFNASDTIVYAEALKLEKYFNRIWLELGEPVHESKQSSSVKKPKSEAPTKPTPSSTTADQAPAKETTGSIKLKLKLPIPT